MVAVVVVASTASERALLRELAQGPGLEVVSERSNVDGSPVDADVLLVSGEEAIARAFDVAGDDGRLGVVGVVRDARAAAALVPDSDVPGWALLGDEATTREAQAAIHAASAGLGSWPASWTDRLVGRREPGEPSAAAGLAVDLESDEGELVAAAGAEGEPLTGREGEVLELLAYGLSNRRMADRLGISEHTVKFHVASIYAKLGVNGRAAAVRRALGRGLISV